MPADKARYQLVFLLFLGGGRGWSFLYSVRDEHTRLRPHKFSLRPKKTADFKSSFIRTRFSA